MKHTFILFFFSISITCSFAQSISIDPTGFRLPQVEDNPTCNSTERGRMVFNTAKNQVFYCNGSYWINSETGVQYTPTPAFQAKNDFMVNLASSPIDVNFLTEYYDTANNFNLGNANQYPNSFVSNSRGVYNFLFQARVQYSFFTPNANTKLVITFKTIFVNGGDSFVVSIPLSANSHEQVISVPYITSLGNNHRLKVSAHLQNAPVSGSVSLDKVVFNGHLVTKY